jgi:hypothetical protein
MNMLCPICKGSLEMRKVAPCYDCGHFPEELVELERGQYEYHVFKLFGQEFVLCDFCDADFDSYDYDYLGVPEEFENNFPLELIAKVEDPHSEEDGYCTKCKHRQAFLVFLKNLRDYHTT